MNSAVPAVPPALHHRTAEVTLTLTNAAGQPLAGQAVEVRQTRHHFLFGCNAFLLESQIPEASQAAYGQRFCELLNFATLPFYWSSYERAAGRTAVVRLRRMARWCARHGIVTKGHPLLWHSTCPAWLTGRPDAEVERRQDRRIARELTAFAGLIPAWDVVNEAVVASTFEPRSPVGDMFRRHGQVKVIKDAFTRARATAPNATLVLNDYDTSPAYETLIQQCLDAGVPFDVIGIQSHMHCGYWGAEKVQEVCARFARFGKPLQFSEATLVSGALKTDSDWQSFHPGWDSTPEGEARQAAEAEEFYRLLFACPAVTAITWWDFADLLAWQGAPAGFLRQDLSPKPVFTALERLIRHEWWTGPLALTTDAAGQVTFRGFLGDYAVTAGKRREAAFTVTAPGGPTQAVRMS